MECAKIANSLPETDKYDLKWDHHYESDSFPKGIRMPFLELLWFSRFDGCIMKNEGFQKALHEFPDMVSDVMSGASNCILPGHNWVDNVRFASCKKTLSEIVGVDGEETDGNILVGADCFDCRVTYEPASDESHLASEVDI